MSTKTIFFLFLLLLLVFIPSLSAQNGEQYHLKLLAVEEGNGQLVGSDADLYLELKDGSGRVFLETFPLTKADTQISTRFAKEIACKHFKLDCEQYDFIYTIKAKSNIIGGPSAGAAIAALTAIAMLDIDYDQNIAITGTINSGAIIGPVAGVKEKLEAASKAGLKKVLVASGSGAGLNTFTDETESINESIKEGSADNGVDDSTSDNASDNKNSSTGNSKNKIVNNNSNNEINSDNEININNEISSEKFDIVKYGTEVLNLEVIEVMNLDEVLLHLTGKKFNDKPANITEDEQYTIIMKSLQRLLCERTGELESELQREKIVLDDNILKDVNSKKESSANATLKGDYYSAASFCFSANIKIKENYYLEKKLSAGMFSKLLKVLERRTDAIEKKLEMQQIKTISDLQTLMIVKERINDVRQQLTKLNESQSKDAAYDLAYAEERFFSALSWMQFFSMDGRTFILDEKTLEASCMRKISESEERYQYISLFLPLDKISYIREKINLAEQVFQKNDFPLCLILASQGKADANAILSTMGLEEQNFATFFNGKKTAVKQIIAENSAAGIFPILGYSYYQYANSLEEQEKFTALLYLEYALEMSDLAIYFPEKHTKYTPFGFKDLGNNIDIDRETLIFIEGIAFGAIAVIFFILVRRRQSSV